MPNPKNYLQRSLTMREAAVVVLVLVALAGAGYFAYLLIAAKLLEARVNEAMPRVCTDIRVQRQKLVNAIEAYQAHFGFYPPDHVLSRPPLVVDAVTNWLMYELAGVTYNSTNRCYQLGRMEAADAKYVKDFFQCDGFKNCDENGRSVTRFLPPPPGGDMAIRQFHDDPDVYVLGCNISDATIPAEVVWEFDFSSWRYVASSPTNNPGKFDLWVEVQTKNRSVTIGNWKSAD